MTNQEKVNYLKRYRVLSLEIDQITDESQRWQDIATRISPSYSNMPHSGGGDKVQTAAVEIAELLDKLTEKIRQAVMLRQNIKTLIEGISDKTLRQLMIYRYINGKKWEEIAVLMEYDYRYVHKLHSKCLCQINEKDIERHYKTMI